MRYSAHHALVLLVFTAMLMSNCHCDAQHESWTNAASLQAAGSLYGKDFIIAQASLSQSFQFADYKTTDTELLFSAETSRQAQVAALVPQLFDLVV
jgi:hypothetical protein